MHHDGSTSEEWRPVPGFCGYEASSHGRIRSIDRYIVADGRAPYFKRGVLLKQVKCPPGGYMKVSLSGVTRRVHVIVAATFIGPRHDGMVVCHNDGNKLNNSALNLRYDTQVGNMTDSRKHGTIPMGENRAASKLTESEVRYIRKSRDAGVMHKTLAAELGVCVATIENAAAGRTWGWLK